jgi:hypothetical protein
VYLLFWKSTLVVGGEVLGSTPGSCTGALRDPILTGHSTVELASEMYPQLTALHKPGLTHRQYRHQGVLFSIDQDYTQLPRFVVLCQVLGGWATLTVWRGAAARNIQCNPKAVLAQ